MRFAAVLLALAACNHPKAKGDGGPPNGDGAMIDAKPTNDGMHPPADADPQCPAPMIPAMKLVTHASGLERPVFLTAPSGSPDTYVIEQAGRIRIVRNGSVLPTSFLDISAKVAAPNGMADGEAGLLGLAFAPDYATSGRFFVYLTTLVGGNESAGIYEYHRSSGNPDIADTTPSTILEFRQSIFNNIAGHLAFGPDGKLYASAGDGVSIPSEAPDITSARGKILRIDIDHPTQNVPGNITGGEPHVWDKGLRNPYRFSFDRVTGELYIGEAGEEHADEIDIEGPGTGKKDYGWPRMEGAHCEDGTTTCANQGTLPALEIPHASVSSVVIGGIVYRGSALPCLRGRYVYAMNGLNQILGFVWDGVNVTDIQDLSEHTAGGVDLTNVTSISQDSNGELYFTTIAGSIYKLVAM